jgi:hypothetical protein
MLHELHCLLPSPPPPAVLWPHLTSPEPKLSSISLAKGEGSVCDMSFPLGHDESLNPHLASIRHVVPSVPIVV